jgi:hypothetical protein
LRTQRVSAILFNPQAARNNVQCGLPMKKRGFAALFHLSRPHKKRAAFFV